MARGTSKKLGIMGAGAVALMLTACADNKSIGGDPGPTPLAMGQSCGSIQQDLNRLLGRGVQGNIERQSSGKSLSPAAKADVDRYNALLNQYLGARCHV